MTPADCACCFRLGSEFQSHATGQSPSCVREQHILLGFISIRSDLCSRDEDYSSPPQQKWTQLLPDSYCHCQRRSAIVPKYYVMVVGDSRTNLPPHLSPYCTRTTLLPQNLEGEETAVLPAHISEQLPESSHVIQTTVRVWLDQGITWSVLHEEDIGCKCNCSKFSQCWL